MKLNWISGRQGTGYYKLKIFESKLLKMDCYILKYPYDSKIKKHNDPAPEGYKHHRINITLNSNYRGGHFVLYNGNNRLIEGKRIKYFRPDIQFHSVDRITSGRRYVLSIGWLSKTKQKIMKRNSKQFQNYRDWYKENYGKN
ncbi:MAG: 2OG-Fe(II) oxygenase [Pseudoalteromonas sp.]|uniref:2OG-Fe(II) oxygenase n=1 Tax=Pseudoalteromonas sp. TaxID=53249 RepID=UPI001D905074|nr:2OG-Fe(II) oxygenase [Pseudoalteromonas sp.]NRA76798.1 2OG-Fe(II) oxygenase [Pseudoalteromonas sp.]